MTENMNKEQLILQAAEQEFFTKGYDGARTTSIAEMAGVTHAMLHYYFRTKEQLFEKVVSKNVFLIARTILDAMGNPEMPLLERLKDGISSHFDLAAANSLLPRFFLNEIVARPDRYHFVYDSMRETIENAYADVQSDVDAAAARGEIEWVNVKMLFLSIMSLDIFPLLVYPFFESLMAEEGGEAWLSDREKFFEARKAENIEIIMRRIKKQ